jgi:hypothetical protein
MTTLFWQNPIISLAIMSTIQIIMLAAMNAWSDSRKAKAQALVSEQIEERKHRDKLEDYRRQDEVARLVKESSTQTEIKLKELNEQGQKIHTLVNSDMTAARTSERDTMKSLLVALKQIQAANLKLGVSSSKEMIDQIYSTEDRIEELNRILADRLAAQQKVDAQTKANKETP